MGASDLSGIPVVVRQLRVVAWLIGVALFLWLPFEDTGVEAVLVFSALISGWWAIRLLAGDAPNEQKIILRHVSLGTLAGLVVSPLALLLMGLKTGLHGHPVADFTVDQIQSILASTPAWILAGLILGLGGGLWQASRSALDAQRE